MAADTIIVDIPALEEAITSFTQCSNMIGECVSSLQANAAEISGAWMSAASDTYRTKMGNLASNVGSAQSALQTKVKELSEMCERSRAAEKSAQSIADSVDSSFMKY